MHNALKEGDKEKQRSLMFDRQSSYYYSFYSSKKKQLKKKSDEVIT